MRERERERAEEIQAPRLYIHAYDLRFLVWALWSRSQLCTSMHFLSPLLPAWLWHGPPVLGNPKDHFHAWCGGREWWGMWDHCWLNTATEGLTNVNLRSPPLFHWCLSTLAWVPMAGGHAQLWRSPSECSVLECGSDWITAQRHSSCTSCSHHVQHHFPFRKLRWLSNSSCCWKIPCMRAWCQTGTRELPRILWFNPGRRASAAEINYHSSLREVSGAPGCICLWRLRTEPANYRVFLSLLGS